MSSERTAGPRARRRGRRLAVVAFACAGIPVACGPADPGYAGRTTESWIADLASPRADTRSDAADALGRVLAIQPHQRDAVRALIGALSDTSDDVRVSAALALAKEGVRADSAIPGLAAVARDSAHPRVRRIAFETLGRLTHSLPTSDAERVAAPIANALKPGLHDPDRSVRLTALGALGGMRRAARGAAAALTPTLDSLTRDVDPEIRIGALNALAALPAAPDVVIADAVRLLGDPAARVRVSAMGVLQGMGNAAASATPALVATLRDDDPDVRRAAAVALGYVMPASDPAATDALSRARTDPDAAVRVEAAHSLGQFHQRGGQDPPPPEPTRAQKCRSAPLGTPGC